MKTLFSCIVALAFCVGFTPAISAEKSPTLSGKEGTKKAKTTTETKKKVQPKKSAEVMHFTRAYWHAPLAHRKGTCLVVQGVPVSIYSIGFRTEGVYRGIGKNGSCRPGTVILIKKGDPVERMNEPLA